LLTPADHSTSNLCDNGILDVAVDSTEFLVHDLLGLDDQGVNFVADGLGLVTTLGNNLGVVS
jgi:hypothetical protein